MFQINIYENQCVKDELELYTLNTKNNGRQCSCVGSQGE